MSAERCELLEGARNLAATRNLDTRQVNCPAINFCDGSYCIYVSKDEHSKTTPKERFFNKLEKWREINMPLESDGQDIRLSIGSTGFDSPQGRTNQ